jgi:hypothetical protein
MLGDLGEEIDLTLRRGDVAQRAQPSRGVDAHGHQETRSGAADLREGDVHQIRVVAVVFRREQPPAIAGTAHAR